MTEQQNADANSADTTNTDAPPAWFTAYADAQKKDREALSKDLDKRFEGFRKKYVEAGDAGEGDDAAKPKRKMMSEDDILAQVKAATQLGKYQGLLPDEAQSEIDEVAETEGVAAALKMARFYAKHAPVAKPADDAVQAAPTIKGKGASPARNIAQLPKTQEEYIALRRKDRAKADELRRQHPDFDPETLPQR